MQGGGYGVAEVNVLVLQLCNCVQSNMTQDPYDDYTQAFIKVREQIRDREMKDECG